MKQYSIYHQNTNRKILTIIISVIVTFSLLPSSQCQANNASSTNNTNSTTASPIAPPPPTTRPVIIGGHCHFCDLCESLSPPPETTPTIEACFNTDNSTVRCMTKSILHNQDKPTNDLIRRCLNNGTFHCLKEHLGLTAEDGKCLKVILSNENYSRFQSCNALERRKEWEQVKESQSGTNITSRRTTTTGNRTTSVSLNPLPVDRWGPPTAGEIEAMKPEPYSVEVIVCSCTGRVCNSHSAEEVSNAEIVEGTRMHKGPGNDGISFYATLLPGGGISGFLVMMAVVVVTTALN